MVQRPLKTGLRFSVNAMIASRASSVPAQRARACASSSICDFEWLILHRGEQSAHFAKRLGWPGCKFGGNGFCPRMDLIGRHDFIDQANGQACAASSVSFSSKNLRARAMPIRRVNITELPESLLKPMPAKAATNFASSAATTCLHRQARPPSRLRTPRVLPT